MATILSQKKFSLVYDGECLRYYCGQEDNYGSPIVDGPEVPEDRDPAQREAEGPRSSMDYSEFPLLDFSPPKK